MNHDSHISFEGISNDTEQNAIEQAEMIFEPSLENMQSWQNGVPEQINDDTIQTDNQAHLMAEPLPAPMESRTGVSPLSANNLWGASLTSPGPSWLIGYNFDLDALNTSVSTTMGTIEPLFQFQTNRNTMSNITELEVIPEAKIYGGQSVANDSVHRGWFSHIDPVSEDDNGGVTTDEMTPATTADQYDIGDNFRSRITQRLRARTNDEPLPSINFLVSPIPFHPTQICTAN